MLQREGQVEWIKLIKKYVQNIICTVRADIDEYFKFANSLHKNRQFTLEKKNMEEDLASVDINLNLSSKNKITCHVTGFKKTTETGRILNF